MAVIYPYAFIGDEVAGRLQAAGIPPCGDESEEIRLAYMAMTWP